MTSEPLGFEMVVTLARSLASDGPSCLTGLGDKVPGRPGETRDSPRCPSERSQPVNPEPTIPFLFLSIGKGGGTMSARSSDTFKQPLA